MLLNRKTIDFKAINQYPTNTTELIENNSAWIMELITRQIHGYNRQYGIGSNLDIEELFQDVCLHLVRVFPKYDPTRGKATTWITWHVRAIMSRKIESLLTDKNKKQLFNVSITDAFHEPEVYDTPYEEQEFHELKDERIAEVMAYLRKENPRWARILELRLQGHTFKKISEEFGVTRTCIQIYEEKAITKLRRKFCPYVKA